MALSKVDFNNINVTPAASKALKWNSSANGFETGDLGGNLILLTTTTLSSAAATIDFTSSIDSTYKEYQFHFTDMHPATSSVILSFQADTGTNTNYNQTITSTFFRAAQDESATTDFGYKTAEDQAQGTAFQTLTGTIGNGNDESCAGILNLFDPASTTFVKHFISRAQGYTNNNYAIDEFAAGYINTTTAITRIRFKFASGNIDAGTFKLYGIL